MFPSPYFFLPSPFYHHSPNPPPSEKSCRTLPLRFSIWLLTPFTLTVRLSTYVPPLPLSKCHCSHPLISLTFSSLIRLCLSLPHFHVWRIRFPSSSPSLLSSLERRTLLTRRSLSSLPLSRSNVGANVILLSGIR